MLAVPHSLEHASLRFELSTRTGVYLEHDDYHGRVRSFFTSVAVVIIIPVQVFTNIVCSTRFVRVGSREVSASRRERSIDARHEFQRWR